MKAYGRRDGEEAILEGPNCFIRLPDNMTDFQLDPILDRLNAQHKKIEQLDKALAIFANDCLNDRLCKVNRNDSV
jgi:hypothetical protein